MNTSDVLIASMIREDTLEGDGDALREVRGGVPISADIWVGELPDTEQIVDARTPKGHNWKATRQFGAYYAIVRKFAVEPQDYRWDYDERLRRAVVFSRLVHPTPTGYVYRARVWRNSDDSLQRVMPIWPGVQAYCADRRRPWLNRKEWEEVGALLKRWDSSFAKGCFRFNEALWHFEKAAVEEYLSHRWVLVSTALESLVGHWTSDGQGEPGWRVGRGKRYRDGLLRLAKRFEVLLSEGEAKTAWHRRSSVVHGAGLPPLPSPELGLPRDELYEKVERIVGLTLRDMIDTDDFARNFTDNKSVANWLGD